MLFQFRLEIFKTLENQLFKYERKNPKRLN